MKVNNKILLGFGMGYIMLAILASMNIIKIPPSNMTKLNTAALLFAIGDFSLNGGKVIILKIKQLLFLFFARIACYYANKIKKNILHNKKNSKLTIYVYWIPKCIANYISIGIRKNTNKRSNLLFTICYILASVLIIFCASSSNNFMDIAEDTINVMGLLPIGLFLLNICLNDEVTYLWKKFSDQVQDEIDKLKDAFSWADEVKRRLKEINMGKSNI